MQFYHPIAIDPNPGKAIFKPTEVRPIEMAHVMLLTRRTFLTSVKLKVQIRPTNFVALPLREPFISGSSQFGAKATDASWPSGTFRCEKGIKVHTTMGKKKCLR